MKTIDLLVQELPALGGFPDGAVEAVFLCSDDTLYFINKDGDCPSEWRISMKYDVEDRWVKVTREQYEAALAAKNDGWIAWGGGECTVQTGVLVDVRYGDGVEEFALEANMLNKTRFRTAAAAWWRKDGSYGDIIAYRLHQTQKAELVSVGLVDKPIDDACRVKEDLNDCVGQAPETEWKGGWLPSAGCECEYQYKVHGSEWCSFECVAVDGNAAFGWSNNTPIALQLNTHNFRPMLSNAERKRDESLRVIYEILDAGTSTKQDAADIYDAIAAGKIPGVKLEG